MLERLRTQIGTAGLVVAIVALVAALGGGAYAATGGSSNKDSKATASAKGKQGKQGKPGKTGPAGPAGAQGPTGPAGSAGGKGDTGAAGINGKDGTNGTNGVAGARGPAGPAGPPGPSCNEDGECLLPSGATETGIFAVNDIGVSKAFVSLSFPLRLNFAPAFHYVTAGAPTTECPGNTIDPNFEPKAEPENLCIYEKFNGNLGAPREFFLTADEKSGLAFSFPLTDPEVEAEAVGSWAVTAP